MTRRLILAVALAATALTTTACGGGFRRTVGLDAPPPDEFLVVARQPLQAPPDLETLPPPQAGAPSRVEPDPVREAQAALGLDPGAAVDASVAGTRGEAALLAAAAAEASDPEIRERLQAEAPEPERRFGLDYLFGYPIQQDPEARAQQLDAAEEARRLREAGLPAPETPARDPLE